MLERQWRESSGDLGEYLRVYRIHSATFDSGVLGNQEVLDELARLKRQGIVNGLTLSGADQAEVLRRARRIDRDGKPLFQLGFWPREQIRHTSESQIGQIYMPVTNARLLIGVIALVLFFGSSSGLASALRRRGHRHDGDTTLLAFVVIRDRWGWSLPLTFSLSISPFSAPTC